MSIKGKALLGSLALAAAIGAILMWIGAAVSRGRAELAALAQGDTVADALDESLAQAQWGLLVLAGVVAAVAVGGVVAAIIVALARGGSRARAEAPAPGPTDERATAERALAEAEERVAEARREAEQAARTKTEFLANMSHELRTPLNAIIGMTSLLIDTDEDVPPHYREFIETIRESGDSLLTIVNDILDFSRIENNGIELEAQTFDLRQAVEAALELLAPMASRKGIELACLIAPEVPGAMIGDVARLRQVLVNLVSNALKFTSRGEVVLSVDLALDEDDDLVPSSEVCTLHVSVRDTGVGIAEERVDGIFDAFTQADASTTRRYGGTGLGLAICRHLVESMGGLIWVESALGHGSTFHFTIELPVAAPPPDSAGELSSRLAGRRVLVVDDNATSRLILILQLRSWLLEPVAAGSAAEALELLPGEPPFELVLIDYHMPETDGLDLAETLYERGFDVGCPMVLLSPVGHFPVDPRMDLFATHLGKPIKPSRLYATLRELFDDRGQQPAPSSSSERHDYDPEMARRLPMRILVAEDNHVNQRVIVQMLERLGYRADVANNGIEVLEALERQRYDVILMDVLMPVMDGITAMQRIRQHLADEAQPYIIAVTADAMSGDRERYLSAGMNDYVSKPIMARALIDSLAGAATHTQAPTPAVLAGGGNGSPPSDDAAASHTP
ncbi:response regulator [Haliangium sp.]|uniref:response regulator n=1 Tax=Haliangium sp. TaxID=2663208 RepID=UPI003D11C134